MRTLFEIAANASLDAVVVSATTESGSSDISYLGNMRQAAQDSTANAWSLAHESFVTMLWIRNPKARAKMGTHLVH